MRRLAVFASGNGTNFEAIAAACERGELPAFRGAHAIEQAFDYGVKVYGVTIHYVDATLDGGRIIAQRAFAYEGGDLAELERRVHAIEHPLYVETIGRLLADGGSENGKTNDKNSDTCEH